MSDGLRFEPGQVGHDERGIDESDLVRWLDGEPVVFEADENEFLILFYSVRPTIVKVGRAEQVFSEVEAIFDLGADGEAAENGILEGGEGVGVAVP